MQHIAVIRLIGDRLAWHAPGASEEPRWLDDPAAAGDLRALLAQRRSAVWFAAPGADVRLLSIPVTPAEKKHIDKSLPYALEEQVAEDIEELHFAHCALDKNVLGVAICARDKMNEWRERLADADFGGVNRWVPEPLVLPWQPGEWCVVLEGDTAIVRCGPCAGFSIERDMAPALLDSVLAEGAPPEAVIVYGSDQQSDLELLPGMLRDVAQWRAGNLCAALLLTGAGDVNLNLLQGAYAARLPLASWWRHWRPVAATFAIAFLVQLAAVYADYRNLQAQNESLRASVQASYRKAFPQGQVVDAEKQLRRQVDALRGTSQSSGFVSLIDRVGAAMAGMPDTSIATINYNDRSDEMRMNILAGDFEGVENLRRRINEAGLEAVMESSSAQDDKVRARLRVAKRS